MKDLDLRLEKIDNGFLLSQTGRLLGGEDTVILYYPNLAQLKKAVDNLIEVHLSGTDTEETLRPARMLSQDEIDALNKFREPNE